MDQAAQWTKVQNLGFVGDRLEGALAQTKDDRERLSRSSLIRIHICFIHLAAPLESVGDVIS